MKKTNKLINWWLSKHGDIYLLHGNNATENGVEGISPFTLIETSRILNVEIIDEGFLFKTLNIDYFCACQTCLAKRFEWLNDKKLWEKPLNDMQVEICENVITGFQNQRIESDIRALLRVLHKEHVEIGISDKYDDYLAFARYVSEDGDELAMKKEVIGQRVYIEYKSNEKDICRGYDIMREKSINLGSNIYGVPLLIANTGADEIDIETSVGRFCIPADARLHLIAPNVLRGRLSVYD